MSGQVQRANLSSAAKHAPGPHPSLLHALQTVSADEVEPWWRPRASRATLPQARGLGFLGDFYCTAALQEGFLNWILSCQDWILQGVHSPKFLLRGIQQMAAPRCFASRLSGAQQGPSPEDLHLLRDEQRSDRARSSPLPEEQRLQQERLAAAGALPRPKAESRSGPKLVLP